MRYRHLVDPSEGKMTAIEYAESLKLAAKVADISIVGRQDKDRISDEEKFCDFIEEVFEEKVVEGSDEELLSDFFREMVDFPLLGT